MFSTLNFFLLKYVYQYARSISIPYIRYVQYSTIENYLYYSPVFCSALSTCETHSGAKFTNVPAAYPLVSLFWLWAGTATWGHYVFSDYGQMLQTAQLVIFPFL